VSVINAAGYVLTSAAIKIARLERELDELVAAYERELIEKEEEINLLRERLSEWELGERQA
jgi:hypothetical protein